LSRPDLSQVLRGAVSSDSESSGDLASPTIYIIAPHTAQTIPFLHANLARTLSDSATAIELLKGVQLLQYFDFAGLVEAVAEVSEALYRRPQRPEKPDPNAMMTPSQNQDIILLQGLGPTVTATYRRSGLVHANALLASLMRSIVQVSRMPGNALVLVEFPVEIEGIVDVGSIQDPKRKSLHGIPLDSAFCGPRGESLRLMCGHETLARTMDSGFDCTVIVHDGLGRIRNRSGHSKQTHYVIETVKDRLGGSTGLWAPWTTDRET